MGDRASELLPQAWWFAAYFEGALSPGACGPDTVTVVLVLALRGVATLSATYSLHDLRSFTMAPSQRSLKSEFHLFFVLLARQTPSHGNRSGVGTYRRRPTRETTTQNLMV